jgi:ankyrin repeat protein
MSWQKSIIKEEKLIKKALHHFLPFFFAVGFATHDGSQVWAMKATLHHETPVAQSDLNERFLSYVANAQKATDAVDAIRSVLAAGANVGSQDQRGDTALHLAAICGSLAVVQLLLVHISQLSRGAARTLINAKDHFGWTALHCTVRFYNPNSDQIVQALLAAGADARISTFEKLMPLHMAIMYEHYNIVTQLLADARVRTKLTSLANHRRTLLHYAASHRDALFVQAILTALAEILEPHTDAMCAIVNAQESEAGYTALHIAATEGNGDVVQALLDAGADASIQNFSDQTPAELARYNGHSEVAAMLEEHIQGHPEQHTRK